VITSRLCRAGKFTACSMDVMDYSLRQITTLTPIR
jgi:hypothetical protein